MMRDLFIEGLILFLRAAKSVRDVACRMAELIGLVRCSHAYDRRT